MADSGGLYRDRVGRDEDGSKRVRVLLLSPSPGADVPCGDVTYTEMLLANPPDGIVYTAYPDALRTGSLIELSARSGGAGARCSSLRRWWFLGLSAGVNRLRRSGLLFRESIRVFEIRPEAFDLVHVHVFSTRFVGPHPPIVSSAAIPLRYLYRDAFGWSMWRVRIAEIFDAVLAALLRADRNMYRLRQAAQAIPFTEPQAQAYRDAGFSPDRIEVIPIPVGDNPARRDPARPPRSIGFIAKDFDAKGGNQVLDAFERLRQSRPDLRLLIAGSPPRLPPYELDRRGITWLPYVERDALLAEVLPQIDVLAYPTRVDGLPFVVVEAMAAGVPVVTSDYLALPSIVGDAGIAVTPDTEQVTAAIEQLLDPERNCHASHAARRRYEAVFSSEIVRSRLGRAYRRALRDSGCDEP